MPNTASNQFDRERQAVERGADVGHFVGYCGIDHKSGLTRCAARSNSVIAASGATGDTGYCCSKVMRSGPRDVARTATRDASSSSLLSRGGVP